MVTFARHANPPPSARPDRADRPDLPTSSPRPPPSYPGPAAPALATPRHTPRSADHFVDAAGGGGGVGWGHVFVPGVPVVLGVASTPGQNVTKTKQPPAPQVMSLAFCISHKVLIKGF